MSQGSHERVLKRRAGMPFLFCGAVFILYGLTFPIVGFFDYVWLGMAGYFAYIFARKIWKDKEIRVDIPPDTGNADCDRVISDARAQLLRIRAANDLIKVPEVSKYIDALERIGNDILERLIKQPDLQDRVRSFFSYYLPTTEKLLTARANIKPDQGGEAAEVKERCDRVLPEIVKAFKKQRDAMEKHNYLDLQVEIDVLENMLNNDK